MDIAKCLEEGADATKTRSRRSSREMTTTCAIGRKSSLACDRYGIKMGMWERFGDEQEIYMFSTVAEGQL